MPDNASRICAVTSGLSGDVDLVLCRMYNFCRTRPESYMNFAATAALSLAMSTDAFAVAISKGASIQKPTLRQALRIGLIFGVIEGMTPIIGWLLGQAAAPYVEAWDHWIAFGLLVALGAKMIHESFDKADGDAQTGADQSAWVLAITGLATSIDAMAVGASLALIGVNIYATAAAIGFSTFVMVTIGIMVGRALGAVIGKRAELIGGVVLIIIGSVILYEHIG
jgi:putative Mn2+ efflux pump MntP